MISLELSAQKANVDIENGTVIVTGVDIDEIVAQIPFEDMICAMEYDDVVKFVAEQENNKREEDIQ